MQLSRKPNPQPLPYKGRGARIKASRTVAATVYTQVIELAKNLEKPHPVRSGHPSPYQGEGKILA